MNNSLLTQTFYFLLYLFLQVFFFKQWTLFEVAFCFVYINFLIKLPEDIEPALVIFIAFLIGFTIDWLYETWGIHSAACLALAFLKPYVAALVIPREKINNLSLQSIGLISFSAYLLLLILIHHSLVLFIEVADSGLFFSTLTMIAASTAFTFFVLMLIQFLFFSSKN